MGEERGDGLLYPTLDNLPGRMHPNGNGDAYLNSLVENVHEQLKYIKGAPSVQMQRIPMDYLRIREEFDARIKDEDDEMERNEAARRKREKNIGGRGERRGS
jgi:histone deacetylase HOS2